MKQIYFEVFTDHEDALSFVDNTMYYESTSGRHLIDSKIKGGPKGWTVCMLFADNQLELDFDF